MKNFKRRIMSVCLAVTMLGAFATVTAYAEPDYNDGNEYGDMAGGDTTGGDMAGGDTTGGDTTGGDTTGGDTTGGDTMGGDTSDGSSSYDDPNGGDYNDDNDYGDNNNGDYTDNGDVDQSTDYDTDYYNNYYNYLQNSDNVQTNDDTLYAAPQEVYDPGMTFDEFEKATDYETATAAQDTMVQMYNSNGSDNDTLSSSDWNDLELNLSKVSSDGTADFGFIKNNDSDKDSNYTILLFIFGVVFVLGSVVLLSYIVVSGVKGRKAVAMVAANKGKHSKGSSKRRSSVSRKADEHTVKRTPYIYDTTKFDTAKIDINLYNDYNDYNDNY